MNANTEIRADINCRPVSDECKWVRNAPHLKIYHN